MTQPGAAQRPDAHSPAGALRPSLIHPLTSIIDPLDPARLFPRPQPLEVELGCGDGSFIIAYSKRQPERNFLAVERLLGRLRKVDRKGRRAGLANLRLVRVEGAYLLEYLLRPGSIEAIHVYFPDPWPKRRHNKHRLINERFPGVAKQALTPSGRVYLRTDDRAYFERMTAVFAADQDFLLAETPEDLAGTATDFETEFQSNGVAILRAAYQRR